LISYAHIGRRCPNLGKEARTIENDDYTIENQLIESIFNPEFAMKIEASNITALVLWNFWIIK